MHFNLSPYGASRPVAMGKRGVVATSQPQAVLAGMEMFLQKGNAVDAAIAMAVALTVLEPTSNGIGSDAFAIVWDGNMQGLNASGKSPAKLDTTLLRGCQTFPELGWLPVTVPGAVSAWMALWHRYGSLPLEKIFAPAIRYATEGFALTRRLRAPGRTIMSAFLLCLSLCASLFMTAFSRTALHHALALFYQPRSGRNVKRNCPNRWGELLPRRSGRKNHRLCGSNQRLSKPKRFGRT